MKEFIVPLLAPVYATYKSVISYADFIVLAANVAINAASSYVVTMPFNWGRTDGTDCDVVDVHRLPEGVQSISHVKAVFVERMGLTLQDITALMGAHTIGRAEDANTGCARFTRSSMFKGHRGAPVLSALSVMCVPLSPFFVP